MGRATALHQGEKRLVFLESRRKSEELSYELRELGVETFLSHSSLAVEERRRSERAFAESRNCVIVATSTLELGVDIGDLDRVIQVDSPRTVASFLQRLGRTGRRSGSERNMLFLVTERNQLPLAAAILLLWERGFVEPVAPPPQPRHLTAQQLLAVALQEGSFGAHCWRSWWGDLALMDDGEEVLQYLQNEEFLAADGDLLMIGPSAEKNFGRRHFMDLLSSFTVEKQLRVLAGTKEIGFVSPLALPPESERGTKPLVLNGYGWRVLDVDWRRFVVDVHPEPRRGDVRWTSGPIALSFELMRAQRDVLLGATPGVTLSARAKKALAGLREDDQADVSANALVIRDKPAGRELWTWAGLRANATFAAALGAPVASMDNEYLALEGIVSLDDIRRANVAEAVPAIDRAAVDALKFSAALPPGLAARTLAERFTDRPGAQQIAAASWEVLQAEGTV
ncbi:helicase-related protein [Bogoriella caseilytica]|uniref:Helicase-like protein n=1 Tax=Bogoriella caseilytica TaxID=56055 RepID=A0A3N2BGY6_9MICO|nr:helicase-related protein [Bogoriella caseilytica]ROR74495.1 helicase-like protein [Bogoriella caseilytica]